MECRYSGNVVGNIASEVREILRNIRSMYRVQMLRQCYREYCFRGKGDITQYKVYVWSPDTRY